jgi:hypothetical protein
VSGIPAVIFDTVSLHVMAQSAVLPSSAADLPKVPIRSNLAACSLHDGFLHCGEVAFSQVGLVYEVSQESIVTDDTLMCKWRMGTENIVARGGLFDVAKQGMLLASFTNDDKLRSVEVSFDVMAFMQQLRRAANRAIFQVRFSSTRIICELTGVVLSPPCIYECRASLIASLIAWHLVRQVVPNVTYALPAELPGNPTATVPPGFSQESHRSASPDSSRSSFSRISNSSSANGSSINSAKSDALSTFMFAPEPRAVISAVEPYSFIYVNKVCRFCPSFSSLFR